MTIDLNRLKSMTKEELIGIAQQVNAPHHHMNKPETLVEAIINKVMEQSLAKPTQTETVKSKAEAVFLTEDALEAALAPLKAKYAALSTVYDHGARCVTLRYNDGRFKHSETMSLSCSLPKFLRKAHEIGKGPLVLRGLKQDEWGRLGGNQGKNIYADTVIAG
jgi:hypothetical protein